MAAKSLVLCSVSWIDGRNLPPVGFWFISGALASWPRRVLMGLVGTANPAPPPELQNLATFRASQEYRALMSCSVQGGSKTSISDPVLDAGWTPPLNKSRFDPGLLAQFAAHRAPIPDDPMYYAGEASGISEICAGRLHPSSTLNVPSNATVLTSALIKFRAGSHTDKIGIDDAKSPVHVPWVWCEYALVRVGSELRLLGQGSSFPSHRWYVNGKQVGECLQKAVAVSETDPALSTGQPATEIQSSAANDRSNGPIVDQDYAIGKGAGINVVLPRGLLD
ncbi:hypothetical protein BH11PSE8_BH11PSE8_47140 [soil metagenome]